MGRRKLELVEIQDPRSQRVTFGKRCPGLIGKADALHKLTTAEILLIVKYQGKITMYETSPDLHFDNLDRLPASQKSLPGDVQRKIPPTPRRTRKIDARVKAVRGHLDSPSP